jgi:hypothetical protein
MRVLFFIDYDSVLSLMDKESMSLRSFIQSYHNCDIFSDQQKTHIWDVVNNHTQHTSFVAQSTTHSSLLINRKRLVSGVIFVAIFGLLYGVWGLSDDSVIFDNHVFTLLRSPQTSTIPRALASSV